MSVVCYRCQSEVTGGCRCPDGITLIHGDCLSVMPELEAGSVDMVLCDPPYGTTACSWDSVIPLTPMWKCLERLVKPNGAIVMMASQPFTTTLISSRMKWFKYCWVWEKSKPNGWQHAKNRPMQTTEDACVFSPAPMGHVSQLGSRRMRYTPMGVSSSCKRTITEVKHGRTMGSRPNQVGIEYESFTEYPRNLLKFANVTGKKAIHPTQKPVALMAYLILTYTNPGETVLDFAVGSGTTLVAAKNLGRRAIGIERELEYIKIAARRLEQQVLPFGEDKEPIHEREKSRQLSMFGI